MVTLTTPSLRSLKKACRDIKAYEGRANFYDLAVDILDDHPLQAIVLIMATWNTGCFRFVTDYSKFLADLEAALKECAPLFESLRGEEIRTVNLDEKGETIAAIYSALSRTRGVEFTGASKVMHLMNRNLFVMWDQEIRKAYRSQVVVGEGYVRFLQAIQQRFGRIAWDEHEKTFAKAIDEYNYVTYTLPAHERQRAKKLRQGEMVQLG